jgi:hypothetical protein
VRDLTRKYFNCHNEEKFTITRLCVTDNENTLVDGVIEPGRYGQGIGVIRVLSRLVQRILVLETG